MFDITFVGHVCYDEIVQPGGQRTVSPGSAVLCGALAAARMGKKVAAITRLAPEDVHILESMKDAGITTFVTPAQETSYMRVVYPGDNVDHREMTQLHNAGFFTEADIPQVETRFLHLAGITDQEFTPGYVRALSSRGYDVSLDVQSFVRRVDKATGRIAIVDNSELRDVFRYCTKMKLDIVEARLLTGAMDIWGAGDVLVDWGLNEFVITEAAGVLARTKASSNYVRFTNRNSSGRTGRGDTTFAGYLAWRQEHSVQESLRFAAAMASIKMEAPGPFSGTVEDVMARMGQTTTEKKQVLL